MSFDKIKSKPQPQQQAGVNLEKHISSISEVLRTQFTPQQVKKLDESFNGVLASVIIAQIKQKLC